MPWPPGSSPVMNDDHATGLCGGIVVPSGANAPCAASSREVRQPALRHQIAGQAEVEAVESENHDAPAERPMVSRRIPTPRTTRWRRR